MGWISYFSKFLTAGCMAQSSDFLLFPITANCLFGHYIHITALKLDYMPFSDGFAHLKPLIVKGRAFPHGQPYSYDLLSFTISVKSNSAFTRIVIVISFSCQVIRTFDIPSQSIANFPEKFYLPPLYDSPLAFLVTGILRLIGEAKIMPGILIHHPPIHKGLAVPVEFDQLLEQCLLIALPRSQEAVNPCSHYQHTSLFCLFLQSLPEIVQDAFVPLLLKQLLRSSQLINCESMLRLAPDYLHSSVVLSCIPEGYCYRTHQYLFLVLYNQITSPKFSSKLACNF